MTLPKMPRCPAILSKKLTFKPLNEKVILQSVRGHFGAVNHVIFFVKRGGFSRSSLQPDSFELSFRRPNCLLFLPVFFDHSCNGFRLGGEGVEYAVGDIGVAGP